jgi:hypothetical protein
VLWVQKQDWLSLVAVHTDGWLLSLAFFKAARFGKAQRYAAVHAFQSTCTTSDAASYRDQLFERINEYPTLYEVVSGKVPNKATAEPVERKRPSINNTSRPGKVYLTPSHVILPAVCCRASTGAEGAWR